jgi:hypothetical protein
MIQSQSFIYSRFKDLPNFGKLENCLQLLSKACDNKTSSANNKTSSAIIYNTIDYLKNSLLAKIQQKCQVPIFPIGPMHKSASASSISLLEEDTNCLAWLDKQNCNSFIYVSFESLAFMDSKSLLRWLEG